LCAAGIGPGRHPRGIARQPSTAASYFVLDLELTNQAAMEPRRAAVGATFTQYSGRCLISGGATELIEGRT